MNKYLVTSLLLAAGLGWYLSTPDAVMPTAQAPIERTESTLPIKPPLGMESSSWVIRSSASHEGITAAGQIFSPPSQTPMLFKVGFLVTQHNHNGLTPEVNFQVILSEWLVDRPAPAEIWASIPRLLPSTSKSFERRWQDFDVPHISLDPNKEYIAWVTLSDLGNPPAASLSIPNMGPSYRAPPPSRGEPRYDYREGRSAFFKEANPNGHRDHMTGFTWKEQDRGHNLHFRMSFESHE